MQSRPLLFTFLLLYSFTFPFPSSPFLLFYSFTFLLFIQHRVCAWVVVHLHLPIDLHVLPSLGDVLEQLVDGGREVGLLFKQHGELGGALLAVLLRRVGAFSLLAHVVDLEREYAQTVYRPCGAFGVEACLRQRLYVAVTLAEV